MPVLYFGAIPLGVDHLTGPTADDVSYKNTDAEHPTTRGKPQVQEIGAERDEKTLSFFFDEGFCNVGNEHARLLGALKTRTPAALNAPGLAYTGKLWRVEVLSVSTKATNAAGRLVRIEASVTLREAPRAAGGPVAIGRAFAGRIGLGLQVRSS